MTDYKTFIRDRITQLRLDKGVSEYQMSLELGQNRNYIQGISSGKALPSMTQFLNICEYFELSPAQFFNSDCLYPQLIREIVEEAEPLRENDLMLILDITKRLKR